MSESAVSLAAVSRRAPRALRALLAAALLTAALVAAPLLSVGLNVFVVSRMSGRPTTEIFIGVFPHVVVHLLLVLFFVLFPATILWLPSTMN